MNGSDYLSKVEQAIEYVNASSVEIIIDGDAKAITKIDPSLSTYYKKLKKNDVLTLSLETNPDYYFTGWISDPENSVEFGKIDSAETTATIIDSEVQKIMIKPEFILRPTVTFLPQNVLENPKNTPIVISFSKPVELTKEILGKIKIEIDNLDVRNSFEEPEISEDKTQVTFKAKRSNLLDIQSGTKTVVITVPKEVAAIENGQEITLSGDAVYAYKVNNQTNNNVEINITCSSNEGELTVSGEKTYYLDNEIVTTFTENENYQITGWKIVANNKTVPDKIIKKEVSQDKKTLKVKVLDGMSDKITVSPVCCVRPQVSFLPDEIESVEKNRPITVKFSLPMNLTQEDLNKITIFSEGEDLRRKNYFNQPVPNEDNSVFIFEPNVKNLIPIENSTRLIEVTIPADFYYIDEQSLEHITVGENKTFTYKINSQTTKKVNFTFINNEKLAGSINVNGNYDMNIGQKQNLTCNVSADYVFIEWQVFTDGKIVPKKDYSEYFEFDEKETDTVLTVKSYSETKYTIEPFCVERPSIISVTPTNVKTGVNYDSQIKIVFDKKLDEKTIYYTKDEMDKIEEENQGKIIDFIYTNPYNNLHCYAYKVDGNLIWKCLSIVDRADKTLNLLDRFSIPVFENSDTLVIKTNLNFQNLLAQRDILVTVNPVFGLTEKCSDGTEKLIPFEKRYSWSYYTNSDIDDDPPEISLFKVYIGDSDKSISEIVDSPTALTNNNSNPNKIYQLEQIGEKFNKNTIDGIRNTAVIPIDTNTYNLVTQNQSIFIQATIKDVESGSHGIDIELIPVMEKDYSTYGIKVPEQYKPQNGKKATFYTNNGNFSSSGIEGKLVTGSENGYKIDLKDLQDGVYILNLNLVDNNLNIQKLIDLSTEVPVCYFLYDGTPPGKVNNVKEILPDYKTCNFTTITWDNPKDNDIAYVSINCFSLLENRPYNRTFYVYEENKNSYEFSYADSDDRFRYSITVYDIFGNSSETVIYEGTTFN